MPFEQYEAPGGRAAESPLAVPPYEGYRVRGERLEMLATANGYAIPITMTSTATRDVLHLYSDETGSDSTYAERVASHRGVRALRIVA